MNNKRKKNLPTGGLQRGGDKQTFEGKRKIVRKKNIGRDK
jgi:hypothetical protein